MCIGIPMQVEAVEDDFATCRNGDTHERLNTLLMGAPAVGDWVLAFQGSALRTMSFEEAQQMRAALAALQAVRDGATDTDHFFADLIGRAPELPAHLKGPAR